MQHWKIEDNVFTNLREIVLNNEFYTNQNINQLWREDKHVYFPQALSQELENILCQNEETNEGLRQKEFLIELQRKIWGSEVCTRLWEQFGVRHVRASRRNFQETDETAQ